MMYRYFYVGSSFEFGNGCNSCVIMQPIECFDESVHTIFVSSGLFPGIINAPTSLSRRYSFNSLNLSLSLLVGWNLTFGNANFRSGFINSEILGAVGMK